MLFQRATTDKPYAVLRDAEARATATAHRGYGDTWFGHEYRDRFSSPFMRYLSQQLEVFDYDVFGDSAWNVSHRPNQVSIFEHLWFGSFLLMIQVWIGVLSYSVAISSQSWVLGLATALVLLLGYNYRWNFFSEYGPGRFMNAGLPISGVVSSLLVVGYAYSQGMPIASGLDACVDWATSQNALWLLGWGATGVLNVRFTRRMFGNPGTGGGTGGRELLAFLFGPLFWAGAVALMSVMLVVQGLLTLTGLNKTKTAA